MTDGPARPLDRAERTGIIAVFVLLVCFHFWGATVAWRSNNLPGGEFRQAQTAIATYFIQQENNFSLAYPTPVLGKPWSIPMEFPLYQWTVAKFSTATGMDLTQAGRAVSLACFYLTLPAVFLLLGHLKVGPVRRLVPLGLILACPLYIYYARAFLIETMALMFSVWFLLAFIEAIEDGGRRWLLLANLAGIGAGLVKVTTFMLYLLPAGAWALWILYHSRSTAQAPGWKKFLLFARWIVGATAVPFAVTLWWLHFADAAKALNPAAGFLLSGNLNGFNFGTAESRVSGDIWHSLWQVLRLNLVWPPVLVVCVLGVVVFGRRWWGQFALCLLVYFGVQMIFPQLYAWHDYYSVASAVLLMAAMGFGLLALLESRLPRAVVLTVITGVFAGQIWLYWSNLYQGQRQVSSGGSGLTEAIHHLTGTAEVIVVVGDDWSSITPYYARRRALMIRKGMQDQAAYLEAAFATLADERVGAVILEGTMRENNQLLDRLVAAFGLDRREVFTWHDATVYLPVETRIRAIRQLGQAPFDGVQLASGAVLPAPGALGGEWRLLADLTAEERQQFGAMQPQPMGFYSSFGPRLEWRNGEPWFSAHPTTRLRFRLPAGAHRLQTKVEISAAAYTGSFSPHEPPTDGVEIQCVAREGGPVPRVLYQRLLDPLQSAADRGEQSIDVTFTLERAAEVDLFFGPGPQGRDTHDWIYVSRLGIH